MNLKIRNEDKLTYINVNVGGGDYEIVTENNYDCNGIQHVPESIIDAFGLPDSRNVEKDIKNELKRRGIVVD